MICCSFIFTPGDYNDEFYKLDNAIGEFARSLEGFSHVENWISMDGKTRNAMYFFKDQESISKLSRFPQHLEAKSRHNEWYKGFRVDVLDLRGSYGQNTEELSTS